MKLPVVNGCLFVPLHSLVCASSRLQVHAAVAYHFHTRSFGSTSPSLLFSSNGGSDDNKDGEKTRPPKRSMVGFHRDEFGDWVAELECGHYQHVRHNPPMVEREWVLTEEGRASFLGYELSCKKCLDNAPIDTT